MEVSLVAASLKRYEKPIVREVSNMPPESLIALLRRLRDFRETLELKPAEESFEAGWREASAGDTLPLCKLWDGVDCR